MTKQEIQEQINQIESGLKNPALPDVAKPKIREKLEKLKEQLKEMEEKPAPAVEAAKEAASTTKEERKEMSESEIRERISQIKKGLQNPALPDRAKPKIIEQLKKLQESIGEKEEEVAVAKEEKKIEKEVEKAKQKAEKKIEQVEKIAASPKTPKKAQDAAKKSLEQVKKQMKEAEKEAAKEKAQRKRGRPKKAAAAKPAAKAPSKPAAKAPKKPVTKRKTKAVVKYEKATTSLERLVNRTKELREKYKGRGVDLDRDANRGAKPFGWRIAGSNRRPTRAEIKSGNAYWEGRANRADVKKGKYPKLEKGGMMADGGTTEEQRFEMAKEWLQEYSGLKSKISPKGSNNFVLHAELSKNQIVELALKLGFSFPTRQPTRRTDGRRITSGFQNKYKVIFNEYPEFYRIINKETGEDETFRTSEQMNERIDEIVDQLLSEE